MSNNIGAPKDSAATDITGAWSVISILKGILNGILNGIKLKLGATDISASNPLPTSSPVGVSSLPTSMSGLAYVLKAQQPAVAGRYSRVQINNPTGSSNTLVITGLTTFAGSPGTYLYSAYEISTPAATEITDATANAKIGGDTSTLKCFGTNSATAIQTTELVAGGSHASATANGTSILLAGAPITLPEGKTLEIVIGTVAVALNVSSVVYQVAN